MSMCLAKAGVASNAVIELSFTKLPSLGNMSLHFCDSCWKCIINFPGNMIHNSKEIGSCFLKLLLLTSRGMYSSNLKPALALLICFN